MIKPLSCIHGGQAITAHGKVANNVMSGVIKVGRYECRNTKVQMKIELQEHNEICNA